MILFGSIRKKLLLFSFVALSFAGFNQTNTNVGTDFWIAFPPNHYPQDDTLKIFIASSVNTSGNLYSAFPGVSQPFTVAAGSVTQIIVPTGVSLSSGLENKGIRITTTNPVAVYGLNRKFSTTDAYLALPVPSLGTNYRIASYTANATFPASLSIVAVSNGTNVSIHNHATNSTTNITLNAGQTYIMSTSNDSEDISGSTVTSNIPVGVFGSNKLALITPGCLAGDHIVEMLFPYNSWGKDFVTVPFAGRDNSGDIFRIYSADINNEVFINEVSNGILNDEDFIEVTLTGSNHIHTTKPSMVVQYAKGYTCTGMITGDPLMSAVVPDEQFLTDYILTTVNGYSAHWTNLVVPTNSINIIYKDGVLIPSTSFSPVSGTNFSTASISITPGIHTFNSSVPFGISIYGWNPSDSYGYAGGCSMSPVATVDSVAITPDTAYGTLNTTNMCFTATVFNTLHAPVQNILVDFYVGGINPFHGFGYTDASGQVQFCYTQTGTTPGTDSIYAKVSSISSTVSRGIWSNAPCNNPTTGGTIASDQSHCGAFIPASLINLTAPSGYLGTLEYLWQQSTTSATTGFSDIAGSDNSVYAPGLITQTTWFRRLSRVSCISGWITAAVSNVIEITITQPVTPSINISSSANPYCEGTSVTVSSNITNGGTAAYQWIFNGVPSGSNTDSYSFIPSGNDSIRCILTSGLSCLTLNPVSSSKIIFHPDLSHPAGISISASINPFCPGQQVTITASPVNPGSNPSFQWKRNGSNAGSNSSTFTFTPAGLDSIRCILTSDLTCVSGNPVSSASIIMNALPVLTPAISVTPSVNPVCGGITVNFSSVIANGGSAPAYQWKVNGINQSTASTFSYVPVNNDLVTCQLSSNLTCLSANPVISVPVQMNVLPVPQVSFSFCFDSITTLNARPIKLKGGIPLNGTYSGPGVNSLNGIFSPLLAGVGSKTITYSYTNAGMCSASKTKNIIVQAPAAFTCGNPFTDIRDNHAYQTIQIGSQCWFSEDLDYGIPISSSQHQRDNCIPEKYQSSVGSPQSAVYQWDEVMDYNPVAGEKGICPAGWHVPTEAEWQILFNNYGGSAFAGSPLKYSGFSGFNAMLNGFVPHNTTSLFYHFATFYWTSTSTSSFKAWAHGMNNPDPSVSSYPSSKENAFGVRCVHD